MSTCVLSGWSRAVLFKLFVSQAHLDASLDLDLFTYLCKMAFITCHLITLCMFNFSSLEGLNMFSVLIRKLIINLFYIKNSFILHVSAVLIECKRWENVEFNCFSGNV